MKEEKAGQSAAAENTLLQWGCWVCLYMREGVGEVRESSTVEVGPLPGSIARPPSQLLPAMA